MHQRECSEPYDLVLLKNNIENPKVEPHQPAAPLTKEPYDAFMMNSARESNRFIPPPPEYCIDPYTVIWNDFTTAYKDYYRKNKSLPVSYNPESEKFAVVIPSPGRPKATNPKSEKIDLRLDAQTIARLDDYRLTNNISRSAAIRKAIELLLTAPDIQKMTTAPSI